MELEDIYVCGILIVKWSYVGLAEEKLFLLIRIWYQVMGFYHVHT
jgi:hypothetical protein